MPDSSVLKRKLWERLKDTYRITILDDENLEEIGSYNISLLNFYIFISVIGLALSILVISFIVFTPVKRLIPGYGDITDNKKFIELATKVDDLEKELVANEIYTKGLQNLLTGAQSENEPEEKPSIEKHVITSDDLSDSRRTHELNFLRFIT